MHRKRAGKPPTLSVQTLPSGRAADNQSASGSVNGSHEADHFTTADKVIAIREYGLLPSLEPVMSPDHAVVWLTSQPDVSLTEQDAKAMAFWLHLY